MSAAIWMNFTTGPSSSRPERRRATEKYTGVPAADARGAARLYATGGNGAIYYGLGVTEHSQGSTTVIAIANLAMATGNIGRPGVGVNPLRGQNNVQGRLRYGQLPARALRLSPRVETKTATHDRSRSCGASRSTASPAFASPTCSTPPSTGCSRASTSRARTSSSPIRIPSMSPPASRRWNASSSRTLFLNETANYAHAILPGSTFLEKDGTYVNAERRIQRIRKVMEPKNGYADWEITQLLANALDCGWTYTHPSQIMDEIAAVTPTFKGVSFARLEELGSIQWPCNDNAPEGTPIMHINGFVRGKGKFVTTRNISRPTSAPGPRFPLLLTTGRILSQYNVGAQTRRTDNVLWHTEDLLEIHPHDAEQRGVREGDWVRLTSRAGETTLKATITDRVAPGVVYTTFHHPMTQANVVTTDFSDWATNCPEYKVTAVQIMPSNGPSEWQEAYNIQAMHSRRIAAAGGGRRMSGHTLDKLIYMANQIAREFENQQPKHGGGRDLGSYLALLEQPDAGNDHRLHAGGWQPAAPDRQAGDRATRPAGRAGVADQGDRVQPGQRSQHRPQLDVGRRLGEQPPGVAHH